MAWNMSLSVAKNKFFCNHLRAFRSTFYAHKQYVHSQTANSSANEPRAGITIPKRKKRDELSILRALESTVKRDTRSPRYMFVDDPFLLPKNLGDRRQFSASKASGRRSAQYVAKTFPEFFKVSPFNPWLNLDDLMKAFTPQTEAEQAADTVEGLQERINMRLPEQAFGAYQTLKEKGEAIPEDMVLSLLDLLCVFNSEDPKEQLMPEERFFDSESKSKEEKAQKHKRKKTWKDSGLAEQLFSELDSPPPRAYCSLIRGRAKYHQVDKAFALYMEMVENKIPIDKGAYNAILQIAPYLAQEDLWRTVLEHMAENGVTPDVITFNGVLRVLRNSKGKDKLKELELFTKVLNEMKALNVTPSLATWLHFILNWQYVEYRELRHKVLDHMEGREFSLQEEDDFDFFYSTMLTNHARFKDVTFAHRVNKLLNTGQNLKMLGDSLNNHLYYNNYFQLMLMFEDMDVVMEHYDKLVPHTASPNINLLKDFLSAIEFSRRYDVLLRLWDDNKSYILPKPDLLEEFLSLMASMPKGGVSDNFVSILDFIYEKQQADESKQFRRFALDGSCIGHMVEVYSKANMWEKAWTMFTMYFTKRRRIPGFPSESCLVILGEAAIESKAFVRLTQVLDVMNSVGYLKFEDLVNKALEEMQLSEDQTQQLKSF